MAVGRDRIGSAEVGLDVQGVLLRAPALPAHRPPAALVEELVLDVLGDQPQHVRRAVRPLRQPPRALGDRVLQCCLPQRGGEVAPQRRLLGQRLRHLLGRRGTLLDQHVADARPDLEGRRGRRRGGGRRRTVDRDDAAPARLRRGDGADRAPLARDAAAVPAPHLVHQWQRGAANPYWSIERAADRVQQAQLREVQRDTAPVQDAEHEEAFAAATDPRGAAVWRGTLVTTVQSFQKMGDLPPLQEDNIVTLVDERLGRNRLAR